MKNAPMFARIGLSILVSISVVAGRLRLIHAFYSMRRQIFNLLYVRYRTANPQQGGG